MICDYCGEEYEVTTDLEESYADDPSQFNVCSGCLFEVIVNGEEINPTEADEVDV